MKFVSNKKHSKASNTTTKTNNLSAKQAKPNEPNDLCTKNWLRSVIITIITKLHKMFWRPTFKLPSNSKEKERDKKNIISHSIDEQRNNFTKLGYAHIFKWILRRRKKSQIKIKNQKKNEEHFFYHTIKFLFDFFFVKRSVT